MERNGKFSRELNWRALATAVERLASAETLSDVIDIVRTSARSISGADGTTFVLRDGGSCHYVDEDAITPLWKGQRFPLTACISGWCMLNNKMAVIPDIYVDERIPHDAYRPTFVKSLVMVPVVTKEPIAAIGSYWSSIRDFSPTEISLLESLARSAAVAISATQMRAALRENEERLRFSLLAGDFGAWEVHLPTGSLTLSELAQEIIFGLRDDRVHSHEELIKRLHPDDMRTYLSAFEKAVTNSSPLALEVRVVTPTGGRWVELHGRVGHDINKAPWRVAGICRDVTKQRETSDRLSELQAKMAQMGRLNEMGEMAATISHELSQPLSAARNYLTALKLSAQNQSLSPDNLVPTIEKAERQVSTASQIILQVRAFMQKREPEKSAISVLQIISEALEMAAMDKRHAAFNITTTVDPVLPLVLADHTQVLQVVLNLLRNAFDAMENWPSKQISLAAFRRLPTEVEVCVADSGPGLSDKVKENLFQPFVTTKKTGMGLGLPLSHSIVTAHGGKLWATDRSAGGTEFHFSLPVAPVST